MKERKVFKKSEIVIGGIYSNGKGRVRKVVATGPEYVLYEGQIEKDNLRYEIVNDGTKTNKSVGKQGNITRTSFAAWAKEKTQ